MTGIVLGTTVNKNNKIPALVDFIFNWEERQEICLLVKSAVKKNKG